MPDFQIQNLSFTARILVNTEALNMAESVGNYTRHRKAPIVIPSENGYSILYTPVVSGESLAHAYQAILAQIASQRGLPVTEMDLRGYFMKFADKNIIKSYYSNDLVKILGLK
jgi:CRISPR-associated protein Csa2